MKNTQKLAFALLMICIPFWTIAQNQTGQTQQDDAQDKTEKDKGEIKTLLSNVKHHGGFIAFGLKASSLNDQIALMPGFRMGWTVDRTIAVGIEGYGLVPTISQKSTFGPTKVRPLFGYGGFFIEPIIGSNKAIHFTFPLLLGAGWAGYIEDWRNNSNAEDLIDEQVFWIIEPAANVEANLTRRLRFTLGASYRMTKEIDLLNANKKEFNGLNYNFSLKLGIF